MLRGCVASAQSLHTDTFRALLNLGITVSGQSRVVWFSVFIKDSKRRATVLCGLSPSIQLSKAQDSKEAWDAELWPVAANVFSQHLHGPVKEIASTFLPVYVLQDL